MYVFLDLDVRSKEQKLRLRAKRCTNKTFLLPSSCTAPPPAMSDILYSIQRTSDRPTYDSQSPNRRHAIRNWHYGTAHISHDSIVRHTNERTPSIGLPSCLSDRPIRSPADLLPTHIPRTTPSSCFVVQLQQTCTGRPPTSPPSASLLASSY